MHWLDDFFSARQGKSNLPLNDQFKKDEDTISSHEDENLVIPQDITQRKEKPREKMQIYFANI